jgi:acetoin utilization protein AcuB
MKQRRRALQVGAVMTAAPVTITSADSLKTAFDLLTKHNVRELPVVENDRLIGIVTDRDLRQVAPSYPLFRHEEEIRSCMDDMKVASAMTPDPLVVAPETAVVEAAELLRTYRVNSLPVVKENRLVGIISVTDLLKLFIEQNKGAATA